ncbi:MAG: SDR family NAD(P)-dependent oxidoreductase [Solirubrobacterales bacterium]|jgi:meso-butanediol dehydrogenase/(S,S)-butanediol dehydrogenase/diacetyl reductase
MLLEGRVVFVTGAARGIGRGIAEALAESGAEVALGDLDLAAASETAELVRDRGRRAVALKLDVTDRASLDEAIARGAEALGRLDGWVNNAGALRMSAASDVAAEDWDAQLAVNLSGLFAACQAASRAMIRSGHGGAIVNVASNAGKVGYANMAAYNASKAAVISLTRSLSLEWAPHRINVNAVCPGGVDTPMLQGVAEWLAPRLGIAADSLHAQMKPRQMERHIQPIEVGRVVAFLLSDRAAIIRGQAINVDGGDTPY